MASTFDPSQSKRVKWIRDEYALVKRMEETARKKRHELREACQTMGMEKALDQIMKEN